ncbi:MAG: lipoyl(octanoyl) transferase LipB [Balneolaceae bacterium]|nr:lipoyl(octanoyl) transferase LipB [Balneolaceae bacterium]
MKRIIEIYDLGLVPYRKMWDLQKSAQQKLIDQKKKIRDGENIEQISNDVLFFVEHPHVYTLGKSGDSTHLLKGISELTDIDAEYIEIDRGGDITYHGPGQIVGYPILDLDRYFTDIHKYLRLLEEVVIKTCSEYGIEAGRKEGLTGVWVGEEKICAMGIRCSRWVTMHGFAFNINTDLSYFNHIVPCGIENKSVTSLSKIIGQFIEPSNVKSKLADHFAEIFDAEMISANTAEPKLQNSYL